jgi:hypothetical protein
VKLFDIIRSAGGGAIVANLATTAGLNQSEAEQALRALLPELGRAIQRAGRSRSGAAAVHAAMRDERYRRYLEQPATLTEPRAAEDGERVLHEVFDDDDRGELVRRVAAAIGPDEGEVRKLLPQVAALAMAALGERLRDPAPSSEIPWFGTGPQDQFDAPLLKALSAMFGHDAEADRKGG